MIELVFVALAFLCVLGYGASALNFSYGGMVLFPLGGFACLVVVAVKLVERAIA